jgi:hypothetical protein
MQPIRSIIVEGVDRLGKDTLIQGLKQKLGAFQVVHYQKPELLDVYVNEAQRIFNTTSVEGDVKAAALKNYQINSFRNMFHMLSSGARLILNRAHLGEMVYAPRYRKYDGSYVLDLERQFKHDLGSNVLDTTLLVLLHASDTSFIKDDGMSFDFAAKEAEQMDFIRAFERSNIRHKLMIDVSVNGGYVPADKILATVTTAYERIQSLDHPVWNVSWDYNDSGELVQVNELMPDPKGLVS